MERRCRQRGAASLERAHRRQILQAAAHPRWCASLLQPLPEDALDHVLQLSTEIFACTTPEGFLQWLEQTERPLPLFRRTSVSTDHVQNNVELLLISRAMAVYYQLLFDYSLHHATQIDAEIAYWEAVLKRPRNTALFAIQTLPRKLCNMLTSESLTKHLQSALHLVRNPLTPLRHVVFYPPVRYYLEVHQLCETNIRRLQRSQRRFLYAVGVLSSKALDTMLEMANDTLETQNAQRMQYFSRFIYYLGEASKEPPSSSSSADDTRIVESSTSIDYLSGGGTGVASASRPSDKAEGKLTEYSMLTTSEMFDELRRNARELQNFQKETSAWRHYSRPHWLERVWFPVGFSLLSLFTARNYVLRNEEKIHTWLEGAQETIAHFMVDWVVEPIVRIYETVRYRSGGVTLKRSESLRADMESLERMVTDVATEVLGPHEVSQILEVQQSVREGDLSLVNRYYEDSMRSPLRNIIFGDMIRLMLIQVQNAKVEMSTALEALDKLLKANELNFAFLAAFPTLFLLWRAMARIRSYLRGTTSLRRQWDVIQANVRDIEIVLNRHMGSGDAAATLPAIEQGFVTMKIGKLIGAANSLPWKYREPFLADISELAFGQFSIPQRLGTIHRMYRTFPLVDHHY